MKSARVLAILMGIIFTIVGLAAEQNSGLIVLLGWLAMGIIIVMLEDRKK